MERRKRQAESILLISCYELGHQPAGISMPMGFLSRAGFSASSIDVSVEGFDAERAARARFVGISVPMHTALRLGVSVAREVRRVNAECHICFYGLYASLNSDYLLEKVADSVIGGEYEEALLALIKAVDRGLETEITGVSSKASRSLPRLSRLDF
ncbi:MAG TPA: cobalamin-dependent protein, partial [Blastocatellia bacterium]|nr:cobalamin-dependent protein [Blastocatellia bacterium]